MKSHDKMAYGCLWLALCMLAAAVLMLIIWVIALGFSESSTPRKHTNTHHRWTAYYC